MNSKTELILEFFRITVCFNTFSVQCGSMFSLFYGLWKYLFKKEHYFVLILGLDNAGKTTFLEQTKIKFNRNYKGVNLNKITTTVGLNIGRIDYKNIVINFWDLGGQQELQSLWDKVRFIVIQCK